MQEHAAVGIEAAVQKRESSCCIMPRHTTVNMDRLIVYMLIVLPGQVCVLTINEGRSYLNVYKTFWLKIEPVHCQIFIPAHHSLTLRQALRVCARGGSIFEYEV